jgi:outer membrane protein OmpU
MNKLTKVGLSALCGSLSAISAANAGEMSVTGGADMTYVSKEGLATGNPIGIGSNLTFKGSGELDNGWTFDLTVANLNANAYSAADLNLTMGGLGSLNVNQGNSGNGLCAYDDKMPTAWEETWGAGVSTGIRTVCGVGASTNIQYTTPKILGFTVMLANAPHMGQSDTADKATTGGTTTNLGDGYDAVISLNPSFGTEILSELELFVGAHYTDTAGNNPSTIDDDKYEGVGGITYALGPVSVGAQWSGEYLGDKTTITDYNAYENHAFGVAFNISDNLSVSYGEHSSRKEGYNNTNWGMGQANREAKVDSIQAAYTWGGASIRYAFIDAKNTGFGGSDTKAKVVSLGLAF